jgi:hypothetical protein
MEFVRPLGHHFRKTMALKKKRCRSKAKKIFDKIIA